MIFCFVYDIIMLFVDPSFSTPMNRSSPFLALMLQNSCWIDLILVSYVRMRWLILNRALIVVVLSLRIIFRCCLIIMSDVSLYLVALALMMIYIFLTVGGTTESLSTDFNPPTTAGSCSVAH